MIEAIFLNEGGLRSLTSKQYFAEIIRHEPAKRGICKIGVLSAVPGYVLGIRDWGVGFFSEYQPNFASSTLELPSLNHDPFVAALTLNPKP